MVARYLLTVCAVVIAALPSGATQSQRSIRSAQKLNARQIASRVLPGVVLVVAERSRGDVSYGSGFAVSADEVVTSRHVVEGALSGYVQLVGQRDKHSFSSVFVDDQNDLAVLTVRGLNAHPLALGVGSDLAIGDDVFVVGNPKGYEGTFSRGVISGLRQAENLIQFDAAISPGSSGSPLVDDSGRVVGVVRSYSEGQNLNFAVPAAYVSRLMTTISRGGSGDKSGTGWESRNPLKRVPSPGRATPHDNATPWLTVTGKGNDFTIEFPAKPLHEYKEPHLLSNKRIEEYLHCVDGFCLYAASLKFESGLPEAKARDQITSDKDEVYKLTREANGWKTTRVTKLSADSYEVEGLAPWVGNGALAPIIQRVIERNGLTYKLECRVMPGRGGLDGDDREVCQRFLDSFRPSVIP